MTGRRLLDVAAIFTAARRIASKHNALRLHQLNLYSKTSSLAKAVKSQTDRVTLTIRAGAALANRFNAPDIQHSSQSPETNVPAEKSGTKIRVQASVNRESDNPDSKQGHTQDRYYDKWNERGTGQAHPEEYVAVERETLERTSQFEGSESSIQERSIHPNQNQHTPFAVSRSSEVKRTVTPASYDKANTALLEETTTENTESAQGSEKTILDGDVNLNELRSSVRKDKQQHVPEAQAVPEQEQLSKEAYSDIFHSPRVAQLLKARPSEDGSSRELELPGAEDTSLKRKNSPQEYDQVSSAIRTTAQNQTTILRLPERETQSVASEKEGHDDVHVMAADIANDADRVLSSTPEVGHKAEYILIFDFALIS